MDIRFYDFVNPRKRRDSIEEDFESQFSAATAVLAFFLFEENSKENIEQINVYCKNTIKSIVYSDVIDGFWDIEVPYDPNIFLSIKDDESKKREFLRVFSEIFEQVFEYKNWNKEKLQKALVRCREVDFKREFLLRGTPKKNPRKDKLAIVKCVEDIKSFKMICTIYDKKGNLLLKRTVLETSPSPFHYFAFLGPLEWNSNTSLTLKANIRNWSETIVLDEK